VRPSRNLLLAAAALTAGLAAVAFVPQLAGSEVRRALDGLSGAKPGWLWTAGACFVLSVAASAGAYRAAFGLVGGRLAPLDAAARYGLGSLVNSFAPARLGDAVRLALFSRALDSEERLWRTGGVFAAIAAARACALALLVVAGALAGALPLWPVLICAGLVGAAAAVAAAIGVHAPLAAAVMIVPALDLAGTFPVTPGNVGVTSGAVAMALSAHGVPMTAALTTGIAFHAIETCAGVGCGLASGLYLVEVTPRRRWTLALAGAAAAAALVGAFSATVLVNVV
jgi:uncharacterized membrane protein YbhN (UPF0104 family)